jgi:hypothetical protein
LGHSLIVNEQTVKVMTNCGKSNNAWVAHPLILTYASVRWIACPEFRVCSKAGKLQVINSECGGPAATVTVFVTVGLSRARCPKGIYAWATLQAAINIATVPDPDHQNDQPDILDRIDDPIFPERSRNKFDSACNFFIPGGRGSIASRSTRSLTFFWSRRGSSANWRSAEGRIVTE